MSNLSSEHVSTSLNLVFVYNKTCVKRPLSKIPKIWFQDQLSLNAGQKYCSMLQAEHSAILSTFIKLPIVIKIFVLSVIEWPSYTLRLSSKVSGVTAHLHEFV